MLLVFPWAEFSYRGRQLLSDSLSSQNYRKSPRQLRLLRSFCQAANVFPLGSSLDPTQQTIQHPLAFVLVARPKTYWLSASVAAGTKNSRSPHEGLSTDALSRRPRIEPSLVPAAKTRIQTWASCARALNVHSRCMSYGGKIEFAKGPHTPAMAGRFDSSWIEPSL